MSNRKINLDRPALSPEQIKARQDFDKVLSQYHPGKPPVWKSPWFWGPTGLASIGIALFLSISYINSQSNAHDKTHTLSSGNLPPDTECIHAPVKGEDLPFARYAVNVSKDEKIVLPSGTEIEIPAGSLQPQDPSQEVSISVREFPDKVSAFIAGIPMDYGKDDAFESAGMIEIRGMQDGREVAINPEKPLSVDMKLTKDPSGFDFWYLDEDLKAWKKHPATYETAEKRPAASASPASHEVLRLKLSETDRRIVAVEAEQALLKKPETSAYKIPEENHQRFDLDFNKKTYPELARFENLVFEIIPTAGYDRNFTKKTWSEVKLEKGKEHYEMVFTAPNEKMKVEVRPVLQGRELKAAQQEFDSAMKDYTETAARLAKEKADLEAEKAKTRKALMTSIDHISEAPAQPSAGFQVSLWGAYNCDKPSRYPSAMKTDPVFVWEGSNAPAELTSLFVFNLDKDMRFSYGARALRGIGEFGLHARDEVVIFAIDREGSYGFCELKDTKGKRETGRFIFSKNNEASSVTEMLKKLTDETVSV